MHNSELKIHPVLIVKNEEAMLGRCLESVKDLDEAYIVDTGSKDATIEVAKKFTDKVFSDFTWNDSFADARNHAKNKAPKGEWILSIDADEILHDWKEVRAAVLEAERQGVVSVNVKLFAEDSQQMHEFPRLFKNVPEVFWNGAIHNHLSVMGVSLGDVRITYGFSPAHRLDPDRALRILEKETKNPERVRELFYLGREYYYRGWMDKSLQCLGKYVQKSGFLAEKAEAFLTMAKIYWNLKMGEDARDACLQAIKINPNFKEAIVFMSQIVWPKHSSQWMKMAETADNTEVLFVR